MDNAKFRLLIVNDERPVAVAMRDALQQGGHVVDVANDARTALPLLRAHPYQLVLSPARLPDGGAAELLTEARRSRPDAQLILVTACSSVERCDPAIAGAFGCVCKPIEPQRLRLVVAKALEFVNVVAEVTELRTHAAPAPDASATDACEIHAGMTISQCEELLIRHTLAHATTNRAHAARLLGISRRTLQYKLKEYGMVAQKREPLPAGLAAVS